MEADVLFWCINRTKRKKSVIYIIYECLAIVLNYGKPIYKDIIQVMYCDDSITSEKTKYKQEVITNEYIKNTI